MGKVMSVIIRKANRFNVENRAHKVLEKEKPIPAPKYEYNKRDIERVLEVYPDFVKAQNTVDLSLNERLKQVYVTSNDPIIEMDPYKNQDPNKPLPLSRKPLEDFEYGFSEPKEDKIGRGRFTLRQAMAFLTKHHEKPSEYTAMHIAEEYKLKPAVVRKFKIVEYNYCSAGKFFSNKLNILIENILDNFKPFKIFVPNRSALNQDSLVGQKEILEKLTASSDQLKIEEKGKK